MKKGNFFPVIVFLFLLILQNNYSSVYGMRNLFLPKFGGDQSTAALSPSIIADNLSNVTNFQSLLGAGRSLAYPFAAGMLLSIGTLANENNWNVSDAGFAKILGIPREEIVESYGALFEALETDENVTLSNVLYSFNPKFSPSESLLDTLKTEVKEVTWTRETWRDTYRLMEDHLSNVTNEKIDTALIPPVIKIGTPFGRSTQAVVVSTFHYINGWENPFNSGVEIGEFQGNPGIPYLQAEGNFLVAEDDEYVAVSVPLEGRSKSIVFVLPHKNITAKYFRKQAEPGDEEEEEDGERRDIVPFPSRWEMKQIRLRVPTFNTTDVDQYGEELEQVGMNETFCTIIRDYYGRFPYYMRPMVQVNSLDFNEDYLEIASATGVAVEKFLSFFSILGGGKPGESGNDDDDDRKLKRPNNEKLTIAEAEAASIFSENAAAQVLSLVQKSTNEDEDQAGTTAATGLPNFPEDDVETTTTELPGMPASILRTISMDRPFLWYLNDSSIGPMFFGTVETLLNLDFLENSTETERPPGAEDEEMMGTTVFPPMTTTTTTTPAPSGNNDSSSGLVTDFEKYYLWSCRSYISPTGESGNKNQTEGERQVPPPEYFNFQFEEETVGTTTDSNLSQDDLS